MKKYGKDATPKDLPIFLSKVSSCITIHHHFFLRCPVKLRRVFAHVAFTFLLLLSQQLGNAHAVSHLGQQHNGGSQSEKQHLPVELQCKQCLSLAALGAGLVSSPLDTTPFFAPVEKPAVRPVGELVFNVFYAFHSRAPPVSFLTL